MGQIKASLYSDQKQPQKVGLGLVVRMFELRIVGCIHTKGPDQGGKKLWSV